MADKISSLLLNAFRDDLNEILNDWGRACLRVGAVSKQESYLAFKRCAHNIKGNAGLVGFDQLKDATHRMEERLATLESLEANPADPRLQGILFEIEKFIRNWVQQLVSNPEYKTENLNVFSKLEAWSQEAGASTDNTPTEDSVDVDEISRANNETVRMPSQKLDSLVQTVGELILAQAIVSRAATEGRTHVAAFGEAVSLCDKLVKNLRSTVLEMRMLPLSILYSRLERAGMELSIRLKKPLDFLTEGQDVALDKAVIDRIFDPLLHLLRNAIDHGLESSQDRIAAGKSGTGVIEISASVVATGVKIVLSDDGRGLDYQKIRSKALENGLISPVDKLTDVEVSKLIFEPGFSTTETVTDISGRGIGLDIVKKEILNLGGQLDIQTEHHKGTKFILVLPTHISLIDVLVVKSQGHFYCVPKQDVAEILDCNEMAVESSSMFKQMTKLRNTVLPIEPISYFMKHLSDEPKVENAKDCVLVIRYQNEILGIKVDNVIDQQQVFIRPLKGYLAALASVTGTTILSNGDPCIIINVKEMAHNYFENKNRGPKVGEQSI